MMFENISKQKVFNLLSGTMGIYVIYFVNSIIQESMQLFHIQRIKQKYKNSLTGQDQIFPYAIGAIIFPAFTSWLIGFLINLFNQTKTYIPLKNSFICGSLVLTSTLTYTVAIYWTNYPIVMMVKSCNLLSVILVGLCCSRVKTQSLKLSSKKLITGAMITVGIFMYNVLGKDDEVTKKDEGTKLWGIPLLVLSLLADGFLPDFQAQIKSIYKPKPTEMFQQINKWVAIICLVCAILLNQFTSIISYLYYHPLFALHMLVNSILAGVGQLFVYRMIKQFKQHIVPFVITTRKIFTVLISIFFYNHSSTPLQMLGIALVFVTVCFQFLSELKNDKPIESKSQHFYNLQKVPLKKTQIQQSIQVENLQLKQSSQKREIPKQQADFIASRIK